MCPNPPYVYTSEEYLKSRLKYWWSIQQPEQNSMVRVLKLEKSQSNRSAWYSPYPLNRK